MVRFTTACLALLCACSWADTILLRNTTTLPISVTYRLDTLAVNSIVMSAVDVYDRNAQLRDTYFPDATSTVRYTLAPGEKVAFARVYEANFDSLSIPCHAQYADRASPCMPVDTFHFTTSGVTYSVATSRLGSLLEASGDDLATLIAVLQ